MNNKLIGSENNTIFYEDEFSNTKVEVRLLVEDVWLNVNATVKHISNIYNDEEPEGNSRVFQKKQIIILVK